MYKKYKRLVYTPSDLLARICKVNLSNAKKFGLICFPRICFRGLIYRDQEPLWLLNVIEDVCNFLGVHIFRLSTRCSMFHSKIMHQSIPPAPSTPPPPGWPPGIGIFFALDCKFRGVGTFELSNPPGWGRKKKGKCPVLRQHCNIFYWSHSRIGQF